MDPQQTPDTAGPEPVSAMPQQQSAPQRPAARNSSIGPIIGAIIIIILLIAGGIYFWQKQGAAAPATGDDTMDGMSGMDMNGTEPGDTGSLQQTGASVQAGVMIPATTTTP